MVTAGTDRIFLFAEEVPETSLTDSYFCSPWSIRDRSISTFGTDILYRDQWRALVNTVMNLRVL
jgi:hypothetical protein